MKKNLLYVIILFYLSSCQFINNDKLDDNDIEYIESLDLLEEDEEILWFDSQLTVKTSGNFLTNKRIASYWIDKHHKDKSHSTFALLKDIDSIKLSDLSNSLTYSSYIEVYKQNKSFKVYIGKDSATVKSHYDQTLKMLK